MAKPKIVRFAEQWKADPEDPQGEDKRRLIQFLIESGADAAKPVSIKQVLSSGIFEGSYRREAFQQLLIGPLRRDDKVFIGTSNKGIFLVRTPEDADVTLGFYTSRVRAELHHARNLRRLAKRTRLMEGYTSHIPEKRERATVYVDESGSPDVNDLTTPYFIVAAVIVESRKELASLDQRFKNAFAAINRPEEHELKTSGLSERKHARVLRELSLLEYQWAAACFRKSSLTSAGFADPKTFYRYAFQFLVGDLLTMAWQADLVLDENSTESAQAELEQYLRRANSGLAVTRLGEVKFAQSSKNRLVQLADLTAGAVRRSLQGQSLPFLEIEDKMINVQFWPPLTES